MSLIEQIVSIEDTDDGFNIITNKQEIEIGISMTPDCCECFGYFMSEDNLDQYIGAVLYGIDHVDDQLIVTEVDHDMPGDSMTMFVNFNTSKGTLQFTAYNSHNGYYAHGAWLKSTQLTLDLSL